MKKIYLCFLLSILCSLGYAQTYIYDFNPADFSISETATGSIINYSSDFEVRSEPCTPIMPICLRNILLPDGAVLKGYSINTSIQVWKNNITLASMPYDIPVTETEVVNNNDCQYNIEVTYPDSVAKLVNICTIDGYQYATFSISPFIYVPKEKRLNIVRRIDITLNVELLPSFVHKPQRSHSQVIKHIVDNSGEINSLYSIENNQEEQNSVEYLIITSTALKDSFEPLRVWKCQKGVNTQIVTLEEIDTKYAGNTPQLRIKQCVYDYYNQGLRFLLLGGDETIVPIVRVPIMNAGTSDITPCDWYYGCFRKQFDWDANGNGIYGEIEDNVDFNSSVSISRLPIRTSIEVQNYTRKLLKYEQVPYSVNTMLLCAQQLWRPFGEYSDAHKKSDNMYDNYVAPYWNGTATRFYDTDTDFPQGAGYDLTSANINEQFNKGYNFIHFATHGDPQYWAIENGNRYWASTAAQLTNNQQPSVITTMACSTNAFDLAEPCLSEAFIRNPNGGAVAYWGSSRAGWGTNDPDYPVLGKSFSLDAWFYKTLFQNTSYNFAEVVKIVKLRYVSSTGSHGGYRWLMCSTNAIGDSELPIYTAGPYYFENVSVHKNANTLHVSVPIEDCTITLSNIGQGGNYMQTYSNVSTADFTDIPNYCTLVITKHNYAPYIQTIDNCYIQNENIAQDFVITGCNEVNIGSNVVDYEPTGNVIVSDTGNLKIINSGVVNIPNGFEIRKGGQLSIE